MSEKKELFAEGFSPPFFFFVNEQLFPEHSFFHVSPLDNLSWY